MHALFRRVRIHDGEEANRLLYDEFVRSASQAPGFVAAYWVETGENHGTSVMAFESRRLRGA